MRPRYGYNSQEESTELNADGNHTTAEFWEYDSRSARRWNLDPVDQISKSNYATFANNPIIYSDLNGDFSTVLRGTSQDIEGSPSFDNSMQIIADKYSSLDLTKDKEKVINVEWDNSFLVATNKQERDKQVLDVASQIYSDYLSSGYKPGESINIIGYSYGGDFGMYMAKELDLLTNGEVKIQIVSLSTPLDLDLVNSIKDKSNIKIDHFFVDNDKTVNSADNNDMRTNGSKPVMFQL